MNLIMLSEAGAAAVPTMDTIWTAVSSVVTQFLTILTSIFNFCTGNPLCLIFLGITFVGIGIRYMRRVVGAFGRGR